jgi:hypothetical protein
VDRRENPLKTSVFFFVIIGFRREVRSAIGKRGRDENNKETR